MALMTYICHDITIKYVLHNYYYFIRKDIYEFLLSMNLSSTIKLNFYLFQLHVYNFPYNYYK